MCNFLNRYEILTPEQNGFREGKSTTLACFLLIQSVLDSLNAKDHVAALYLDLSKAFDLVNHSILLEKLERYGIRGPAYLWIESYLKNRKQITRITKISRKNKLMENYDSSMKINTIGVPQGSVLGPLLFLIYINDLPKSTKHQTVLFADDTTIIVRAKNDKDLEHEINTALSDVIQWLEANKLRINTTKTKYVIFSPYNSNRNKLPLQLNNNMIQRVAETNFLGVMIDEHCNWKSQVQKVCKTVNKFVYALKKISSVTSIETAIMVYHSYICSVFRYGIVLWGNSTDIQRVFLAQKKCIRAIWIDLCLEYEVHRFLSIKI